MAERRIDLTESEITSESDPNALRAPLSVDRLPCCLADLQSRDPETFKPLHVVNMTIKDSAEESAAASGHVLDLCRMVNIFFDVYYCVAVVVSYHSTSYRYEY